MAWASKGTLGSVSDKTAGTSIVLTTVTTAVSSGNAIIVIVAKDNASTTDGNTNEVTSVTDSAGNAYTKSREYCGSQGAADGGATVCIYHSIASSALSIGGTITANFSDSRTASDISAWAFTVSAGAVLTVQSGAQDLTTSASSPGTMTISGLTSAEYLFVQADACERDISSNGQSPYTAFTSANTSGASGASNMGIGGGWRILTGTGDSGTLTTAAPFDHATTYIAIQEAAPVVGNDWAHPINQPDNRYLDAWKMI